VQGGRRPGADLDRNRLTHRLDDKQLRGRNGGAACRTGSGTPLGHGRQDHLLTREVVIEL
jgi:hypothetical protein